jgi:hypothetical protein
MNGLVNRRNSPLCAGGSEISGKGNGGGCPSHVQESQLALVAQVQGRSAVFEKERTLGWASALTSFEAAGVEVYDFCTIAYCSARL